MSVRYASASAGVLFTFGDLFAQWVTLPEGHTLRDSWDSDRTARMAAIGVVVNGPYFVSVYKVLDRFFPMPAPSLVRAGPRLTGAESRSLLLRAFRKGMAAQIFSVPPYLVLFLSATTSAAWAQRAWRMRQAEDAGVEWKPASPTSFNPPPGATLAGTISETLLAKGPSMFLTGFLVWPVVNTLNFRYFAGTARLLVMNTCSLGWNSFLSWQLARKPAAGGTAAAGARPRSQIDGPGYSAAMAVAPAPPRPTEAASTTTSS
ncbi:hypothetical protein H9P43_000702 [Blastocladiella emersonii ATCC 22665]|nr:hypothetical protein H9P43_000702 [Blastocladiella emersonii ATCC 22665]